MGSSSKKYKEKESRKRRHRSDSEEQEQQQQSREKRHRHRRHHKDRRRDKPVRGHDVESDDSDVVEVIPDDPAPLPPQPDQETPSTAGASSESLSVAETNKLRAKLGLKPLAVNESREDGKIKDDLGEFYHRPADHLGRKAEREKLKRKLAERKERRKVEAGLTRVKTLGEAEEVDDTAEWVERNRRMEEEKVSAQRRAKMLEELDEQFGVGQVIESEQRERRRQQYTERNLKGLRVEHDIDNFSEGKSVVLTLKDKDVLDEEEDDVLVNVNLVDDEKYKKNIENKKKKNPYNAYDVEELDEFGNPKLKSLLYKYDEEIEGEKKKMFVIGETEGLQSRQSTLESVRAKLANKKLETLLDTKLSIASDYYNEEELAKFKKPKKKVKKLRTKGKILTADELEQQFDRTGIEDIGTRRPKMKEEDFTIDDMPAIEIPTDVKVEEKDDELERALHKARKAKQKENVMADMIGKTEVKDEPAEDNMENSAIILNSTAEFCRTLGDIPTYGKSGNREEIEEELLDFDKDIKQDNDLEEKEEEEDVSGWNSVDPNAKTAPPVIVDVEVPILDEEPDVSAGVGAALKLAMSKGYLEKEQNNRASNSRLAHLQAKHYSIEDKSYGDEGDRTNRRERYSGPIQDFKEREGFKPNVKLEYIDDDGHVLNSKEAFRYLSHKFHGKGPGKNKVEKRIKKSVQEGLMKKMSSTDTPLGTLNMLQAKQKEIQSPYIVLSGSKHTHSSTAISKTRR